MARYMGEDVTTLYRVVVLEKTYNGERVVKSIYGPYSRSQTAGFVKAYMTNGYWSRDRIVDSWIETAEPVWERHGE